MPRGAKPGERRGGRAKGTPNKATAQKRAEIVASGLTPLDYMLTILRNEQEDADKRFEAAKAAAPYVHPRLSTVDANLGSNAGINVIIKRYSGD